MLLKVCGMRDVENVSRLLALKPDFVGFIFYNKSKRFVSEFPQIKFPKEIKKVGVFVNERSEEVINIVDKHQLDYVQLHGDETAEYCIKIKKGHLECSRKIVSESHKLKIIKAFSVDENFDFGITKKFETHCDYFLFDTKGTNYGGNGVKFNWEILQKYHGEIPFLLSGGISKDDAEDIKKIKHPAFKGIDVNSGFEIQPGLKSIQDIKEFKNKLL